MAVDYSLHTPLTATVGRSPSLPSLPHTGGQKGLALGSSSVGITGPCEVCICPEEKVRLDVKAAAADLDPANSPLVLPANLPTWFHLGVGTWYLKASAT
jgi:hypothetical protein